MKCQELQKRTRTGQRDGMVKPCWSVMYTIHQSKDASGDVLSVINVLVHG